MRIPVDRASTHHDTGGSRHQRYSVYFCDDNVSQYSYSTIKNTKLLGDAVDDACVSFGVHDVRVALHINFYKSRLQRSIRRVTSYLLTF